MRGNRADGRDLFADYVAASKLLNLRAGTFFSNFENFFLGVAKGKWTATTHRKLLLRRDVFAQRCMSAERNVRLRCTLARRLVWTALVCSVTQGAGIRGRAVWNDAGHSWGALWLHTTAAFICSHATLSAVSMRTGSQADATSVLITRSRNQLQLKGLTHDAW